MMVGGTALDGCGSRSTGAIVRVDSVLQSADEDGGATAAGIAGRPATMLPAPPPKAGLRRPPATLPAMLLRRAGTAPLLDGEGLTRPADLQVQSAAV